MQTKWELLRSGEEDGALQLLRDAYGADRSSSHAISLGVGYLWARSYEEAFQLFQEHARSSPTPGDSEYAFAGVAKWCLEDGASAVETWGEGLDAPYAVGGLGIQLPILLFAASILRPAVFPRATAERLISGKVRDARIRNWPGPIGKYLLGEIDDAALDAAWREPLSPNNLGILSQWEWQVANYRWQCRFYEALHKLDRVQITRDDFRREMRSLVDTTQSEWSEERQFIGLIRMPGFFLARHEAYLLAGNS